MTRNAIHLFLAILMTAGLQAAVLVSDNETTAPTLVPTDTGYILPTTNQRFGWDNGEGFTQSFTITTAGTIGSIFLGYNAFDNGDTITLNLSVNGISVQTGIVLNGDNFSGNSSTDGNGGPYYWMKFDLSSENVAVNAGSNNFTLLATAVTSSSGTWAFAPRLNQNGGKYSGGELSTPVGSSYSPPANSDMAFAVTVVPEPSTSLLVVFAATALLLRRRRA